MTELRVTLHGTAALTRQLERLGEAARTQTLRQATTNAARVVEAKAQEILRAQVGRDSELARSFVVGVTESDTHHAVAAVGPTAEHAVYLEYGTGVYGTGPGAKRQPIVIVPKTKQALFWPGARHPVRRVVQQGLQPRPYLRPAFQTSKAEATRVMAQTVTEAFKAAIQ